MYRHRPAKIAAGIGLFAVLFILVTTSLLIIVPQELMSSTTSTTYTETWSQPIMTVGGFIFSVGIPLACAVIAYTLTTKNHPPRSVVIGFLVGGSVFILGNAIVGVTVTRVFASGTGLEQSLLGHIRNSLPHGLGLFGGGLVGVAGALIVEKCM